MTKRLVTVRLEKQNKKKQRSMAHKTRQPIRKMPDMPDGQSAPDTD